jgi:small membrane protein
MLQQIIALVIIALFIWRLIKQKRKQRINKNEFLLWLVFWLMGALAIVFIRQIDQLVINLGFSGTGINFLLYLTVIILFYLVFKLHLSLAKTEANLTKIARKIALDLREKEEKINDSNNNK